MSEEEFPGIPMGFEKMPMPKLGVFAGAQVKENAIMVKRSRFTDCEPTDRKSNVRESVKSGGGGKTYVHGNISLCPQNEKTK